MAQRRQYPAFHQKNGILNLGLVPRLVGSCGHDRGAVVFGHLGVRAVKIGLIAAGAIDAGARVVGHDEFRRSAHELEGAHVAVDPVRQMLTSCGVGESVSAGAEHRDE
jgi:hypothetical protein